MVNDKRFVIGPHADVELGIKRNELEYFLTFPDSGISPDTGIVFFISGFGSKADFEYERNKLRPYLAEKYNCVAVGVNYFGIGNRVETGASCEIDGNCLNQISDIYKIPHSSYLSNNEYKMDLLFSMLRGKGISKLDQRCKGYLHIAKNEYQSFGFLPAIDHLQVLSNILKTYNLNRKK